jgi:hypothetical protein
MGPAKVQVAVHEEWFRDTFPPSLRKVHKQEITGGQVQIKNQVVKIGNIDTAIDTAFLPKASSMVKPWKSDNLPVEPDLFVLEEIGHIQLGNPETGIRKVHFSGYLWAGQALLQPDLSGYYTAYIGKVIPGKHLDQPHIKIFHKYFNVNCRFFTRKVITGSPQNSFLVFKGNLDCEYLSGSCIFGKQPYKFNTLVGPLQVRYVMSAVKLVSLWIFLIVMVPSMIPPLRWDQFFGKARQVVYIKLAYPDIGISS